MKCINASQPSVAFDVETSQLFYMTQEMAGCYMIRSTENGLTRSQNLFSLLSLFQIQNVIVIFRFDSIAYFIIVVTL